MGRQKDKYVVKQCIKMLMTEFNGSIKYGSINMSICCKILSIDVLKFFIKLKK